jgi:hypothetical protein
MSDAIELPRLKERRLLWDHGILSIDEAEVRDDNHNADEYNDETKTIF